MKNLKISAIIVLFGLAFLPVSCDKKEEEPKPPSGTTPLNETCFYVDGNKVNPNVTQFTLQLFPFDKAVFSFVLSNTNSPMKMIDGMVQNDFEYFPKKYTVENTMLSSNRISYYYNDGSVKSYNNAYCDSAFQGGGINYGDNGYVDITYIDTVLRKVSGNFKMTLCGASGQYPVVSGSFYKVDYILMQ